MLTGYSARRRRARYGSEGSPVRRIRQRSWRLSLGGLRIEYRRKVNRKRSTQSRYARHIDPAVVLPHDAVDDRQPQSRSFADWLGREEGIVDFGEIFLRNAAPGILNRNRYPSRLGGRANADGAGL